MRNTLADLNNHLFEQLERLNDEDLTDEQLDKELKRVDGMTRIASQIIQNGELAFRAIRHADDYGYGGEMAHRTLPPMLSVGNEPSENGKADK